MPTIESRQRGGGEDYSGSTAWHNSTRSRLGLLPAGKAALTVMHIKANLGAKADPVRLEWVEGVPLVADTHQGAGAEAVAKAAEKARDDEDKAVLVALAQDFDKRGERVTAAMQGSTTAFKVLSESAEFPTGMSRVRFGPLLRQLETEDQVFRRWVQTPDSKRREILTCSPAHSAADSLSAPSGTGGGAAHSTA